MWEGIAGLITLATMILKLFVDNSSIRNAQKDKLHADWKDAVDSGDPNRISTMFARLRAFKP